EGWFAGGGGGIGLPGMRLVSADEYGGTSNEGKRIDCFLGQVGFTPGLNVPGEVHGGLSYTWTLWKRQGPPPEAILGDLMKGLWESLRYHPEPFFPWDLPRAFLPRDLQRYFPPFPIIPLFPWPFP